MRRARRNAVRRPMSPRPLPSSGIATRGRSRRRAICTAVAFAMYPYFELANIVMAYVLGSTIAGVRFGRGPAVVGAIANVLAFDFCFVPPRFTFSVADAQYIVTFAVMLIVTRRHRQSHGERSSANARRRRARAAHCAAVRDEPGACGDARRRQHGARRSQTCCRSLRLQSGRAAAGREQDDCTIPSMRRSKVPFRARICPLRSGSSIMASVRDLAPIRCRRRRRCMSR